LIDRFFDYLGHKQPNGCILWAGNTNKDGYGVIGSGTRKGRMLLAHRVSYEILVGPIPNRLEVLHRCDTPPCISPACLFLGTVQDNMADKVAKGRQLKGESIPWAILTENIVREMRRRHASGEGTIQEIADDFGVSFNATRCAIRMKTWKHVL
jgi:hypothetical protein